MPKQHQMPNMQQMLAQVGKMQKEMERAQEGLKSETVEASSGGGMVSVTISGDLAVKEMQIEPAAIDRRTQITCGARPGGRQRGAARTPRRWQANQYRWRDRRPGPGRLGGLGLPRLTARCPPTLRRSSGSSRALEAARASGAAPPSAWRSTSCALE